MAVPTHDSQCLQSIVPSLLLAQGKVQWPDFDLRRHSGKTQAGLYLTASPHPPKFKPTLLTCCKLSSVARYLISDSLCLTVHMHCAYSVNYAHCRDRSPFTSGKRLPKQQRNIRPKLVFEMEGT